MCVHSVYPAILFFDDKNNEIHEYQLIDAFLLLNNWRIFNSKQNIVTLLDRMPRHYILTSHWKLFIVCGRITPKKIIQIDKIPSW